MIAIQMVVEVGEDRQLIIRLPPEIPVGLVDLTVTSHSEISDQASTPTINTAREVIRAKLLAANLLATDIHAPEGTQSLPPETIQHLMQRPEGSPSLDEMIDEDRS